jgi:hypothetical protein
MSRTSQVRRSYEPLLAGSEASPGEEIMWLTEAADLIVTEDLYFVLFDGVGV